MGIIESNEPVADFVMKGEAVAQPVGPFGASFDALDEEPDKEPAVGIRKEALSVQREQVIKAAVPPCRH